MTKNRHSVVQKKYLVGGNSSDVSLALGAKLSLNDAVLKRLLSVRQNNKLKRVRTMCSEVFHGELKPLWLRSGIPIKEDDKCINLIEKLCKDFQKVKKLPADRTSEKSKAYINNFTVKPNQFCDLSPKAVKKIMMCSRNDYWKEDYDFLKGQRHFPQLGSMGCKAAQTQGSASAVLSDESEDDDKSEVEFDLTSDDEFDPESSRSTPRPKSATLEIPTKTLSKDTGLSADATNLSIRSHTIMQAASVNCVVGDINKITLSKSSCHRQRNESRLNKSDVIKSDFILEKVPMLTHVVIHWDSKMINCWSLLAEEFRLLPEIRLLQGDEQQTIHKQ
ncbi:hypothetical protein OUZ56_009940 [Daphnia magna]|uniref:Uncharacterized protein n=1 Tax=Daphnia magna TaxID=35525 RepID=A0ABR0AHG9_9CRUS|nr:hypothetical protein OUZ56_009940 [Daphnia magna]